MTDLTPAEITRGAMALGRLAVETGDKPLGNRELAAAVLRAVLPDHDARVRVPLLDLIRALADDGPCDYDHNDYCHGHSLDPKPCPHERAKRVLARAHANPPTTGEDPTP